MQTDGPVTANVTVFLSGVGGDRHFTVENEGSASARNVELKIESEGDKNPPVLESELEKKFPIAELAAGAEINYAITKHTSSQVNIEKEFAAFARKRAEALARRVDWEQPEAGQLDPADPEDDVVIPQPPLSLLEIRFQ